MILERLQDTARQRGCAYLVVGAVNTLSGYAVVVGLCHLLEGVWPLVATATLASLINITLSFVNYKLFVFKDRGGWLAQYLRCYVVYGSSALFSIGGLWVLVEQLTLPVWLAQVLVMGIAMVGSFAGHELFTFKSKRHNAEAACAPLPIPQPTPGDIR
jgi:putative flippase GtrA